MTLHFPATMKDSSISLWVTFPAPHQRTKEPHFKCHCKLSKGRRNWWQNEKNAKGEKKDIQLRVLAKVKGQGMAGEGRKVRPQVIGGVGLFQGVRGCTQNPIILRLSAFRKGAPDEATHKSPGVWGWAIPSVFLHMHAKETHIHAIDLFKSKECLCSIGKGLRHLTRIDKPPKRAGTISTALHFEKLNSRWDGCTFIKTALEFLVFKESFSIQ